MYAGSDSKRHADRLAPFQLMGRVASLALGLLTALLLPSLSMAATWSVLPPTAPPVPSGQLSAVSCSSASACTAVGSRRGASGAQVTLVERWNGRKWSVQPSSSPPSAEASWLSDVACTSSKTCLAVGGMTVGSGVPDALVERWR